MLGLLYPAWFWRDNLYILLTASNSLDNTRIVHFKTNKKYFLHADMSTPTVGSKQSNNLKHRISQIGKSYLSAMRHVGIYADMRTDMLTYNHDKQKWWCCKYMPI